MGSTTLVLLYEYITFIRAAYLGRLILCSAYYIQTPSIFRAYVDMIGYSNLAGIYYCSEAIPPPV